MREVTEHAVGGIRIKEVRWAPYPTMFTIKTEWDDGAITLSDEEALALANKLFDLVQDLNLRREESARKV